MSKGLFLIPVTMPEFRRTAITQVDLYNSTVSTDIINQFNNPEEARIWGVKNSRLNKKFYDKMNPDDYLLFYHKGKYKFFGEVENKFETDKISNEYWDEIPADLLYSIKCFKYIDLPKEDLNKVCEYKKSFQPQSIKRISNSAYREIRLKYGSVEKFIDLYTETTEP